LVNLDKSRRNPWTKQAYKVSKEIVHEAFQRVKENKGAAGVDDVNITAFESDLTNNLYNMNRMSLVVIFSTVKQLKSLKRAAELAYWEFHSTRQGTQMVYQDLFGTTIRTNLSPRLLWL